MTKELFEREFGHLPNSDDATTVFGAYIQPGKATIGDIRKAFEHRPQAVTVYRDLGSDAGFYVSNVSAKRL